MKLLFAIGTLGNGGAERVVANLSNQFANDGHEVSILTIFSGHRDYALDQRVTLYGAYDESASRGLRTVRRFRSIRKQIKAIQPDVVISFLADVNLYVILSLLGLRQTLVVSERNDPGNDPAQPWMRALRNRLYARVNGIVFQTGDAKAYFRELLPQRVRTAVIPNPLAGGLPLFQPDDTNQHFIVASRLNKQKNLPMIVDAMRTLVPKYPDCKVSIFGEGPEKDPLSELIHANHLEDHIMLKGFEKNIHEHMRHACALLISSDYEGISNSMLEALGIGLPVISTDCPVGGARMFIRHGVNGYLIPCGDSAALADAMQTVLTEHTVANRYEANARAIRDTLSITTVAQQWYDFLRQTV
ncbi:MAG TPA: glycosyltransferase [Candidatus Limiplasma sp.]|nr:glycosyltransferase [Candidatus Limiplasma sp.]